jgi:hypothetical protein
MSKILKKMINNEKLNQYCILYSENHLENKYKMGDFFLN